MAHGLNAFCVAIIPSEWNSNGYHRVRISQVVTQNYLHGTSESQAPTWAKVYTEYIDRAHQFPSACSFRSALRTLSEPASISTSPVLCGLLLKGEPGHVILQLHDDHGRILQHRDESGHVILEIVVLLLQDEVRALQLGEKEDPIKKRTTRHLHQAGSRPRGCRQHGLEAGSECQGALGPRSSAR